MRGIAFDVTYNDGGVSGGLIGYRGVCSDRNIVQNVKAREKPWCSKKGVKKKSSCACRPASCIKFPSVHAFATRNADLFRSNQRVAQIHCQ